MHNDIAEKIYNRFLRDPAGFCTAFTKIFYDTDGKKQELYDKQIEFMNLAKPNEKVSVVVKSRQCIPGDTLVYTENGPEYIEKLFDSKYRGKVYSYDDGYTVLEPVEDIWATGEKELYRIKTASGEEIKCTADHKIYVEGEWKRADEIKIGDILTTFEGEFGNEIISDEEVIAMGYFITDGTYTTTMPKFTNNNLNYIQEFENCIKKLFNVLIRRYPKRNGFDAIVVGYKGRNGSIKSEYAQYLIDLNMRGATGSERILPPKFLNLNKSQTALLLNRIFAGDGWYATSGNNRNEVGIGSQSLKFLYQVAYLLSKFGIHASINKEHYYEAPFYKLRFSAFEYVKKFSEEIGIYDKHLRHELVQTNVSRKDKNRVKKIEKLDGLHKTYDMTVSRTHNYYANGILVHNCGISTAIKGRAIHKAYFGTVPNILICSASHLQAIKLLREVKEAINSMPEFMRPELVKETETEVHFASGTKIISLPANPSTVRGFSAEIFLDEFGVLSRKDSEEMWAALLPSLTKGWSMTVVSTPRGKNNLFFDLCNPKHDDEGNVVGIRPDKLIKIHWSEVPHVKKAVEEMDLTGKMPHKLFLQEYCCEFVDDEESILFDSELLYGKFIDKTSEFVTLGEVEQLNGSECPERLINTELRKKYQQIYVGFDPAISVDGSVITVWGVNNDEWEHLFIRTLPRGMEVGPQCDYVSRIAQYFRATKVGHDKTGGMGLAFESRLKETPISHLLFPVTFSTSFKTQEYTEIKNKIESHKMKSPEHHEMIKQFKNLGYNPVTGRIAAMGSWRTNHDDIPSAILCAHACRTRKNNSGFSFI